MSISPVSVQAPLVQQDLNVAADVKLADAKKAEQNVNINVSENALEVTTAGATEVVERLPENAVQV